MNLHLLLKSGTNAIDWERFFGNEHKNYKIKVLAANTPQTVYIYDDSEFNVNEFLGIYSHQTKDKKGFLDFLDFAENIKILYSPFVTVFDECFTHNFKIYSIHTDINAGNYITLKLQVVKPEYLYIETPSLPNLNYVKIKDTDIISNNPSKNEPTLFDNITSFFNIQPVNKQVDKDNKNAD